MGDSLGDRMRPHLRVQVSVGLLDARAVPERYAQLGPLLGLERRDRMHVDLGLGSREDVEITEEPRIVEHVGDLVVDLRAEQEDAVLEQPRDHVHLVVADVDNGHPHGRRRRRPVRVGPPGHTQPWSPDRAKALKT